SSYGDSSVLHSFPTRRSSDLRLCALPSSCRDRTSTAPTTSATAFSARFAANKTFIDFDQMLAANGVTFWADHASTQLMEYLKGRSEEHTSELQSRGHLVCRLL